ncbi:MAG TPA: XdhC/CoxI family protein [Thermoanaerobaculia bacterium]|jgi:xanthine dehydrogenase accessory factor|nr:XdhC/CoxI family protein [Thermoanaerobaculia bacterium]
MVTAVPPEVLSETERSLQTFGRVVLCQIVRAEGSTPGKVGWKLLARPDGSFVGNLGGGAFEALVKTDALEKLRVRAGVDGSEIKRYYLTEEATRGEPTGMVCGGMAEVFLEVMIAAPVLAICGGGPVGQALARAALLAGFEVLVVDDRPEFRNPELFPAGVRFAEVDRDYTQGFLAPLCHRDLYVAVVSRCWETDTAALAAVLRQAPGSLRYLGLMGSRRKVARVREELAAQGCDLAALGARAGIELHAPIGLPIGGDSPGEIAISILAEVIGTRYEKSAVDA